MKILHVINSLNVGGAEKLLLDQLELFEKTDDIVCDLLVLSDISSVFESKVNSLNKTSLIKLQNNVYSLKNIIDILPYMKRYSIIHVHLFPAQYYVVLAKLLTFSTVKLVFTEHSTSNRRLKLRLFNYLERIIYAKYSKIVCITNHVKHVLKSKINLADHKLVVVENGINIKQIELANSYSREKFGYSDKDVIMIMVGGFRIEKDQDTVINSLINLPSNYKLVLVGDGERRSILENLVHKLNFSERVKFLGVRSDVYSLLKMCDISILSSHWEGFGIAAVESMACSVPVIATNVDGLAQVVDNCGMLFKVGDTEQLVKSILKLENVEIRSSFVQLGIKRSKLFSINTNVQKLLNLYYELY
nr:glycosyltransferase [uncultured Empedobacter sp.]